MQQPEFTVDQQNLYQEEYFTDMKSATVRRLTPVKQDGTLDKTRKILFVGQANLMSEAGPIPITTMIPAKDLQQAVKNYPEAMGKAMEKIQEEIRRYHQEQEPSIVSPNMQQDSRIIVPGR
ncbi:MAG: cytoplasmic protein [Desulfobacterales bacterium]